MKKGFTLVELMVVIGILALLMAVLFGSFGSAPEKAEEGDCQQYVHQVADALTRLHQDKKGLWPKALRQNHLSEQGLDEKAAYPLAAGGYLSLSSDGESKLTGTDRFGLFSRWGQELLKQRGLSCTLSSRVKVGGSLADHRLRYALDLDGDGIIEDIDVSKIPGAEKAQSVSVRATAAVWCLGPKGEVICSWTKGQTEGVR